MTASEQGCQLYLITPPAFEPSALAERLKAALDAGPVACLQLRLKDVDDDTIKRASRGAASSLPRSGRAGPDE